MLNKNKLKNYLSYESLNLFAKNFLKKISRSYLLIEFGFDYLNICEAIFVKGKISFKKIKHIGIPSEAMEKGIPNEPEIMGKLIKDTLKEENILTSRVAIVISQDSVYTRLINIPDSIKETKVESYLRDPKSLIQIPIQLSKSDFAIRKTNYELQSNKNLYFLTAMPKSSMNNLIKVCETADLNLNYVETGFKSISRLIQANYLFDNENTYLILLDFAKHCTFLTLLNEYGPISIDRISSIKNYPFANSSNSSNNETEYLPISKYDLKVLVREIKKSLNNFFLNKGVKYNFKLILSGFNSAHPNLTKELSEYIKLPTFLISPTSIKEIGQLNYVNEDIYECVFTKIFGLSLGLLDPKVENQLRNTNILDDSFRFIEKNIPETKLNPVKSKNDESVGNNDIKNKIKNPIKSNNIDMISNAKNDFTIKEDLESKIQNYDTDDLKLKEEEQINNDLKSNKKEKRETIIDGDVEKINPDFKLDTNFLEFND